MASHNDEPATIVMPRIEGLPSRQDDIPTRAMPVLTNARAVPAEAATRTMASSLLLGLRGRTTTPTPPPAALVRQTETIVCPRGLSSPATNAHAPKRSRRGQKTHGAQRWIDRVTPRKAMLGGLAIVAIVATFSAVKHGTSQKARATETYKAIVRTDIVERPHVSPTQDAPKAPTAKVTAPVQAAEAAKTVPAVEHLAAGREGEALAAYRALQRSFPNQPVYEAIAAVLERRVAAKCRASAESGDTPCATK